jgi:hypothetical protein
MRYRAEVSRCYPGEGGHRQAAQDEAAQGAIPRTPRVAKEASGGAGQGVPARERRRGAHGRWPPASRACGEAGGDPARPSGWRPRIKSLVDEGLCCRWARFPSCGGMGGVRGYVARAPPPASARPAFRQPARTLAARPVLRGGGRREMEEESREGGRTGIWSRVRPAWWWGGGAAGGGLCGLRDQPPRHRQDPPHDHRLRRRVSTPSPSSDPESVSNPGGDCECPSYRTRALHIEPRHPPPTPARECPAPFVPADPARSRPRTADSDPGGAATSDGLVSGSAYRAPSSTAPTHTSRRGTQ